MTPPPLVHSAPAVTGAMAAPIDCAEPPPVGAGRAAGQRHLCFHARRGLHLKAISFPEGRAPENGGGPVLWPNIAPAG